jgi:hypothetical protein
MDAGFHPNDVGTDLKHESVPGWVMRVRVGIAVVVTLCLGTRPALPQAARESDERIDRIVGPLAVGSYGWVPGTRGEVTASLVDLGAPPSNDLPVPAEQVRGAAVIVEPRAVPGAPAQVMRAALARALAQAGATAMPIPSNKPNRMLFTSAFGFYPGGPLPVMSVAREDVLLLRRLLGTGPVRVALDVANTIDASPTRERNVIAEIRGTTPEMVLVGAHFDSWDPGQGAQDDGVGHAVSDTFDKVDPRMLALDTAVMAVTAYRLADASQAPGPRLSPTDTARLLEKLGLESLRRAVYAPAHPR